jgi:hypothetical protein
MEIQPGEIYGKHNAGKLVMYSVLKVSKKGITLQNIDNPLSLFETTAEKLLRNGYQRISQTPYVDTAPQKSRKRKTVARRPSRCPYTMDFLEGRADCQKPSPLLPGMPQAGPA